MDSTDNLRATMLESMRLNGDQTKEQRMNENRIKFDKTINLGHVLTALTMSAAVIISWSLMDKRVTVLEEARLAQRERDSVQDLTSKDKFQEVRDALVDLRRSVEKVSDKVGAK